MMMMSEHEFDYYCAGPESAEIRMLITPQLVESLRDTRPDVAIQLAAKIGSRLLVQVGVSRCNIRMAEDDAERMAIYEQLDQSNCNLRGDPLFPREELEPFFDQPLTSQYQKN